MEQSFVAWAKMRAHRLPQVKLGIGDDAALLAAKESEDCVVTTDSLMEGVHFRSNEVELHRVGAKLVKANLSDLVAMAAEPYALFLSMCIPTNAAVAADVLAAEVYEGVCEAAEEHSVALAGGDTNCWDGPLVLSMTAIGRVAPGTAWLRSGARPGDLIVVTGPLGGSILGKHLDFAPRFDISAKLRGHPAVHAAMDISDGLSVDLLRMCDASNCGGVLELAKIPISEACAKLAQTSGKQPVEHALGDGEDFELLLAIAPDGLDEVRQVVGDKNIRCCGEFTSRTGLWMREGSRIFQLTTSGYVHGR
ncbi:MAG: thiamine-phosphate kinase [Planctomycetota bacterium]